MLTTRCHILIASSELTFRARIKQIIRMIAADNSYLSIVLSEARTIDELENEFDTHTSIAFVDADFFIKRNKYLSNIWKRTTRDCIFAVLLSENNPLYLEETILQIEKQKALPLNIHVLKSNYPDDLIRRVISRMIDLERTQKSKAVA